MRVWEEEEEEEEEGGGASKGMEVKSFCMEIMDSSMILIQ